MEELQEMCRVCMAEAEVLLDIYDKEKTHVDDRLSDTLKKNQQAEPTLPDLMKECSPIAVELNNEFPKKVCDPCLRKLREAIFFRRRYIKSMDYMRRVKIENKDQAVVEELEMEEWELKRVKNENEEEEEDEENEEPEEDEEDEEDEENEENEENEEDEEDEELDEDEEDEEEMDDFDDEDEDDEYVPKGKKQKTNPGSFRCPDCPKTFTTKDQLTIHSRDHSQAPSPKQNGTNTRPKRRSVKY